MPPPPTPSIAPGITVAIPVSGGSVVVGEPIYPNWPPRTPTAAKDSTYTTALEVEDVAQAQDDTAAFFGHSRPNPNLSADTRGRFIVKGYKDVPFALAFLGQLTLCVVMAANNSYAYFVRGDRTALIDPRFEAQVAEKVAAKRQLQSPSAGAPADDSPLSTGAVLMSLTIALAVAASTTLALLVALKRRPSTFIYGAIWLSIFMCGFAAVASAFGGSFWMAILFALCCVLNIWYLHAIGPRVPFSAALLSTAVHIVFSFKGILATLLGGTVFMALYAVVFLLQALPYFTAELAVTTTTTSGRHGDHNDSPLLATTGSIGVLLLITSFFWTQQVVSNTIHVTTCGTAATYFFAGPHAMPPNPTLASFKRATTTSLGSICFGSLLVAILQTLRFVVRQFRRSRDNFVRCVVDCILSCIESLVRYFNVYAYCHVAIYGGSYIESAKKAFELMNYAGWDAIINDQLVLPAMRFGTFWAMLISGVVAGLVAQSSAVGVAAGLLCLVFCDAASSAVWSSVVTLFCCFAECPNALQYSNPDLYGHFCRAALGLEREHEEDAAAGRDV